MAENTLIPNTFQHHNVYVDWLSYYLTPEEEKVLNKAIREIIGWHESVLTRRNRIALSVFVEGKKMPNGKQVCMGCGLSRDAVRAALNRLHEFNILVKVGLATQDGQEFELVEDADLFRWDALRLRRRVWDEANRDRTSAAREALEESRQEGVLSDSTEGVLSDSKKETHIETQVSAPKEAREPAPELEYEDVDEDDYPVTENRTSRHKWQIADTEEQKEFLAVCGAKYFELKQKRKVKALIKAFDAGDIAGTAVYERCLKHLEDKTQLEDVPPLLPRDWYDYRVEHARANHWNRWGFINALLDRDKLAEHCRIRQREIERNPVRTFRTVEEAERSVTEPVVLDLEQMKRDAAAAGFRWVEG